MADLKHIAFLLECERLRKEDLKRKLSSGEIDMKEYIDSLPVTNPEILGHFIIDLDIINPISPEDDIIFPEEYKYDGVRLYKTPEEIIDIYNQTSWVPYESLDFSKLSPKQANPTSGLVRAPKFGVKHKINLVK